MKRALGAGSAGYVAIALLIAVLGGLVGELPPGMLVAFVVYAAFAAFVHELIVGISAMHAGWFPAFAVALITLIVGILLGFPPVALALLVGFSASTGPAFADMGYDLKAGFILRGSGADRAFELDGRRQQLYAAMLALLVAIPTVYFAHPGYFAHDLVPPVARVYIATIKAGATVDVAKALLIWAIPGAVLQLLGGPRRQLGILFATGLLIPNPWAGWAVLVGILIRVAMLKWKGAEASGAMEVLAAGFIGGDELYGFFDSVIKTAVSKGEIEMLTGTLGTLTIGQAPRPDVVPIIDRHVPERVRRIHRGVLDGLSDIEIAGRYLAEPGEAALVTRLQDGRVVELSRSRMRVGVELALKRLEAEGCDVILILCTGTFDGLHCERAWLVEPDHIIPSTVAGLVGKRQLGVIVPITSQIDSERDKWGPLARPPLFASASPYSDGPEAVLATGERLQAEGAEAVLLDCIGFTERHRDALAVLDMPVILSNAVVAKAVGELFGG